MPKESARGGRRHGLTVEEVKDAKEKEINEIAIPLLNISRPTVLGEYNPKEVQSRQIYIGSAGYMNSFGYEKNVEVLIKSLFNPEKYFCFGFDYRLPVYYNLLSKEQLDEVKDSPTFDPSSFSREYGSIWSSTVEGSAFDYQKLEGLRTVKKAEHKAERVADNVFYFASVDVGYTRARTVVSIFKVFKLEHYWRKRIVNFVVMEGRNFTYQSTQIKQLDEAFNFDFIAVDGNGLGVGLIEKLMEEQFDTKHELVRPGFNVVNHNEYDSYKKLNVVGQQFKIHVLKTSQTASDIDTNAYNQLFGGKVELLINEYDARGILFEGDEANLGTRLKMLEPYRNTTLFVQETNNLRMVQKGESNKFKIQRIDSGTEKDTYSSVSYGLWVVVEYYERPFFISKRKGKTRFADAMLVN